MIYTRNKESFKKTTQKVQHSQAQANILNLVKDLVSKKAQSGRLPENVSKNIPEIKVSPEKVQPDRPPHHPIAHRLTLQKNTQNLPKLCQSRYQSSKENSFTIEHIFDYTVKGIQFLEHEKGDNKAHKQYLQLLEEKINRLENQISRKGVQMKNLQAKIQEQRQQFKKEDKQKENLLIFYHQSRNCLILMSVQLIQCKRIVLESSKHENQGQRIKAINNILNKAQELLEVFRGMMEKSQDRSNGEIIQQKDSERIAQTCKYQQKTIEFLRKENQKGTQFNQLRLLRHQINRLSAENEKLLKKLVKIKKQGGEIVKTPQKSGIKQIQNNSEMNKKMERMSQEMEFKHEQEVSKIKKQFEGQIYTLKEKIIEKSDLAVKFKEEKECLIQFLDEAREKTNHLESAIRGYEQQINYLTKKMGKEEKLYFEANKQIASTEEFMKALKPFPRYQKLLLSIVNTYEQKISLLQQKVIEQRSVKEKFMEWSGSVYRLLESTNISQQILQKHMEELYSMDKIMDDSKIEVYLRQIRALSVGVDENEVKEMESQLEEYIISLKGRNQVIKEVDFEDGSSVAMSETFTDREFQDDQQ